MRLKIYIKGIVQGVGFRPFIYKTATDLGLAGFVFNTNGAVSVEVEGAKGALEAFKRALQNPPRLAKIHSINIARIRQKNQKGFKILPSKKDAGLATVSPDIAVCDDCLAEIADASSPRYRYGLINCTNCGPRYSIVKATPYDRKNTAMARFAMCDFCRAQYEDPRHRMYHAQPVACKACGPKFTLYENGKALKTKDALAAAAELFKSGETIAVKGVGGFLLMCGAFNSAGVQNIKQIKQRGDKPLAVMFKSLAEIEKFAHLSAFEKDLITSKERPITLVRKKTAQLDAVAPQTALIGVFLPPSAHFALILEAAKTPLVATSANLKGESIIYERSELLRKLSVRFCLDYNRKIINPIDDSVVQEACGHRVILRFARGYAPLVLPARAKPCLAVGANQKSQIALSTGANIITSPYIGDLNTLENTKRFERTIQNFKKFYGLAPKDVRCDAHPLYYSSAWAHKRRSQKVFHHHAHILSVMCEHGIDRKVLGVAFDGTGLGADGTIWGGEFLRATRRGFKRVAFFKPLKLIGGDAAVKDISRLALAKSLELGLGLFDRANPLVKTLSTMHAKNINTVYSSSVGRIFDLVAYLGGFVLSSGFEGQTGLVIESFYSNSVKGAYPFEISKSGVINYDAMILEILKDANKTLIASKFLNTLAQIIARVCAGSELDVVLSGGVFQNKTLLELTIQELNGVGKRFFLPSSIAIGDGSVCVGQAYFKTD
ncbi:MAG: carbamoyltransferase HypF [Helicobacteraceae bacterium]